MMIATLGTLFPTIWHVLALLAVLLVLFTLAASFLGAREMAEGFDLEEGEPGDAEARAREAGL